MAEPRTLQLTKEEMRKKRHESRIAAAEERHRQIKLGNVVEAQRLTLKHLTTARKADATIAPTETERELREQQHERLVEHLRHNFERHEQAAEHQQQKKIEDVAKKSLLFPRVAVYLIQPIQSQYCLDKIKINANQRQLHGEVLWIAKSVAIVLLFGGKSPMHDMMRLITVRMKYENSATVAVQRFDAPITSCDAVGWRKELPQAESSASPQDVHVREYSAEAAAMKHLASARFGYVWDVALDGTRKICGF